MGGVLGKRPRVDQDDDASLDAARVATEDPSLSDYNDARSSLAEDSSSDEEMEYNDAESAGGTDYEDATTDRVLAVSTASAVVSGAGVPYPGEDATTDHDHAASTAVVGDAAEDSSSDEEMEYMDADSVRDTDYEDATTDRVLAASTASAVVAAATYPDEVLYEDAPTASELDVVAASTSSAAVGDAAVAVPDLTQVSLTWTKMAEIESHSILAQVASLRQGFLNAGYPLYAYHGQRVTGTKAVRASSHVVTVGDEELFGALSREELRSYTFTTTSDSQAVKAKKREQIQGRVGMEPVISGHHVVLPIAALTASLHVDRINSKLANLYTSVTFMCLRAWLVHQSGIGGEEQAKALSDIADACRVLRAAAGKIRSVLTGLGAAPVIEPTWLWMEKFPGVKF